MDFLIFVSLVRTELLWREGEIALIMLAVTLVCLALGWLIAHLFNVEPSGFAPVILVTGFGSSSLLGFALIAEVFPHDEKAMAEAAIISGLGVQPDHSHPALTSVLDGVYVAGAANTFLVTLAVGLLLQVGGFREIAFIAAAVGVIKLVLMPLLLWLATHAMDLAAWQVEVLILEGAMPSAMLAVVICSAYGADAKFASRLVFATTVLSIGTVPIIFELLS